MGCDDSSSALQCWESARIANAVKAELVSPWCSTGEYPALDERQLYERLDNLFDRVAHHTLQLRHDENVVQNWYFHIIIITPIYIVQYVMLPHMFCSSFISKETIPTHQITFILLLHHGPLDITVGYLVVNSVCRHLIETLQLHLNQMALTHLEHEDLPFTKNALFRMRGVLPLLDSVGNGGGGGGGVRASTSSSSCSSSSSSISYVKGRCCRQVGWKKIPPIYVHDSACRRKQVGRRKL
jgi:hypothetical protein